MLTPLTTGAVFWTVTVFEPTSVPVLKPSRGVTRHFTWSFLVNEAPVRVLVAAPETVVPFTVQR